MLCCPKLTSIIWLKKVPLFSTCVNEPNLTNSQNIAEPKVSRVTMYVFFLSVALASLELRHQADKTSKYSLLLPYILKGLSYNFSHSLHTGARTVNGQLGHPRPYSPGAVPASKIPGTERTVLSSCLPAVSSW